MSVYINRDVQCCGLREIDGLGCDDDPKVSMLGVAQLMFGKIEPTIKKVTAKTKKPKNPYIKPAKKEWISSTYGEKYWASPTMGNIYEHMVQEWEDDWNDGLIDATGEYIENDYDDYGDEYDDDNKWRYAVFTQAGSRRSYGKKFAALITSAKLGTVVQATKKTVKNPNSGNILKAWLWTVNHNALQKWAQKEVNRLAKEKR